MNEYEWLNHMTEVLNWIRKTQPIGRLFEMIVRY